MKRIFISTILVTFFACNDNVAENGNLLKKDTIIDIAKTSNIDTPKNIEAINNNDTKSNDQTSKINNEDLIITESKVSFNSSFDATLSATIKNNFKKTIIAVELEFAPPDCNFQNFKMKVLILPGKELKVHQKIPKDDNCFSSNGKVFIMDYVFSDGTRQNEYDRYVRLKNSLQN